VSEPVGLAVGAFVMGVVALVGGSKYGAVDVVVFLVVALGLFVLAIKARRRVRRRCLHFGYDGLTIANGRTRRTVPWPAILSVRVLKDLRGRAVALSDLSRRSPYELRGYRISAYELAFSVLQWRAFRLSK